MHAAMTSPTIGVNQSFNRVPDRKSGAIHRVCDAEFSFTRLSDAEFFLAPFENACVAWLPATSRVKMRLRENDRTLWIHSSHRRAKGEFCRVERRVWNHIASAPLAVLLKLSATDTLMNCVTPGEEMDSYIWTRELINIPAGVHRADFACQLAEDRKAVVRLYEGRLLVETLTLLPRSSEPLITLYGG